MKKLIILYFLCIVPIVLTSCYGSPDSWLVNLVGRDMKNYTDLTKNQSDENISKDNYLILYFKEASDTMKLILLDTSTGIERLILQGHLGFEFRYGLIIPEKKLVIYSFVNHRSNDNSTFVRSFNYEKNEGRDEKVLISESDSNTQKASSLNCEYITNVFATKDKCICFKFEKYEAPRNRTSFVKCFKVTDKGILTAVADERKLYKYELDNEVQSGEQYASSQDNLINIFIISPTSDYLPANYKKKYNGLYLHNQKLNKVYRISRRNIKLIDIIDILPIWLDGGRKVIWGSYIYDCTGKQKEKKLVDGKIISLIKIS